MMVAQIDKAELGRLRLVRPYSGRNLAKHLAADTAPAPPSSSAYILLLRVKRCRRECIDRSDQYQITKEPN